MKRGRETFVSGRMVALSDKHPASQHFGWRRKPSSIPSATPRWPCASLRRRKRPCADAKRSSSPRGRAVQAARCPRAAARHARRRRPGGHRRACASQVVSFAAGVLLAGAPTNGRASHWACSSPPPVTQRPRRPRPYESGGRSWCKMTQENAVAKPSFSAVCGR